MTDTPDVLLSSMNRVRHKSATARLLIREALALGWALEDTDDERFYYLIDTRGIRHPMFGMNTTLNSYTGTVIATLKDLSLHIMQDFRHVLPATAPFTTHKSANDFLAQYHRIVVKPLAGAHGKGVHTNLTTETLLKQAITEAKKFGDALLLQEHVDGNEHRVLVVDGRFVAAIERQPAAVTGDGQKTVAELIEANNKNRVRDTRRGTLSKIKIEEAQAYLGDKGITSIPGVGVCVQVAGVSNLSRGGTAVDVTDEIAPDVQQLAVEITQKAGLTIAGIDLLIKDRQRGLAPGNIHFLELNSQPGIRMHHFPSAGQKRNVAIAILTCLEQKGRP